MTSSTPHRPCPIWDGHKAFTTEHPVIYPVGEETIWYTSPRAGGRFGLNESGTSALRERLTDRQKANLSYWIYKHNLEHRLFDAQPSGEKPIVVDQDWVVNNRDRTPSASDRVLMWMQELIRCDDAGEERSEDLQMAVGSCRNDNDLWLDLFTYAKDMGWVNDSTLSMGKAPGCITIPGRIYVEEQLGALGRSRQAFVAMWFDDSMGGVYRDGIKPAIEEAGYAARRIDQKDFVGGVVDEIVTEIRKSRFVVADFTTSPEAGVRGGVYFEAGFAFGLDIPLFLTCRKDCTEAVHFDIGHLNRLGNTGGSAKEAQNPHRGRLGTRSAQPIHREEWRGRRIERRRIA